MSPQNLQAKNKLVATRLASIFLLLISISITPSHATDDKSAFGLTNFAFSSYLGTGFYTSSGQDVFILHLPFQHTIIEKTVTDAGWVLNLPLTVGLIDFGRLDNDILPAFDDVTTLTFLPGIEYQKQITPDWMIIPFADYGFARDLNNTTNILITGIGIKSYANFKSNNNLITLGNRFLYAREKSESADSGSDYTLIETGLNYRFTSEYQINNKSLHTNLYYINFYYPDDLVFFEQAPNPIRIGIENEVGVTFSNLPDFLFFKDPELGIGIRRGSGLDVYRIVFGAPF